MTDAIERLGQKAASRHDALVAGVLVAGVPTVRAWRAAGPVPDADTRFEIGSITKAFTGVLLADMEFRGEVRLDDPVSAYLPDSQLPEWHTDAPSLEELATHRAGLPNAPRGLRAGEAALALGLSSRDPWADVDLPAYHGLVRRTRARKPPKRGFGYSSLGFGLLGDALAARAGMSYEQLLQDRICAPLGLQATDTAVLGAAELQGHSRRGRARPPLRDHMPAAGAIRSSVNDLLRFLGAVMTPAEAPPGPALARATEPRARMNKDHAIGLGWMILARPPKPRFVWHNGGTWGFASFAAALPDHGCAVVVLTNNARPVSRLGFELAEMAADAGGSDGAP
jgi:serine-type D-Ala-D-Ala carboxypeptidase/endopeptidase